MNNITSQFKISFISDKFLNILIIHFGRNCCDSPAIFSYCVIFIYVHTTAVDIVACPLLDSPSDGSITVSTTTPGSTVSYTCELGYILDGLDTRTCLDNGTWTGFDPLCNRM